MVYIHGTHSSCTYIGYNIGDIMYFFIVTFYIFISYIIRKSYDFFDSFKKNVRLYIKLY